LLPDVAAKPQARGSGGARIEILASLSKAFFVTAMTLKVAI
jgi:hypothetical protein